MIYRPLAPIAQAHRNSRAACGDGGDRASQPNRNTFEPVNQPARARRANGAFPELVLQRTRQAPQPIRTRHEAADARRPNIWGSVEHGPARLAQTEMQGS